MYVLFSVNSLLWEKQQDISKHVVCFVQSPFPRKVKFWLKKNEGKDHSTVESLQFCCYNLISRYCYFSFVTLSSLLGVHWTESNSKELDVVITTSFFVGQKKAWKTLNKRGWSADESSVQSVTLGGTVDQRGLEDWVYLIRVSWIRHDYVNVKRMVVLIKLASIVSPFFRILFKIYLENRSNAWSGSNIVDV